MTKYFTLPVLLCALAIASFARISVSAPTNGSTLPSPVNFVATADSSHGIVKWQSMSIRGTSGRPAHRVLKPALQCPAASIRLLSRPGIRREEPIQTA